MHASARQRLQARLAHGTGWTALRLDGVIDEHNGLEHVLDTARDAIVLLVDLGGVRRINSVGVRDWVLWLRSARARFPTVVLYDCPPAIVNEINLVRNFAEGAVVTTFQAPYFCDRCGLESVRTLDALAMVRAGERSAPAAPCGKPACANALDDADESYFAFFADVDPAAAPDDLDAMVRVARAALSGVTPEAASAPGPRRPLANLAAETRHPQPSGGAAGHPAVPATATGARSTQPAPVPPVPPVAPVPPVPPVPRTRDPQDVAFVVILVFMLAALGVLVYLITTLE